VAELGRCAGGAAEDPPVEHDPAADPGAHCEHDQIAGREPVLVVVGLGERRDGRVVVDEHRHPRALAEHLAQRHVPERDVHRRAHAACLPLDDGRDPDADRGAAVAGRGSDRARQLIEQRLG
jgi:hypothetical protein